MKIAIVGAGYVGLTSAGVFAKSGHEVSLLEKDKNKLSKIKTGEIPFYEPGLPELIREQIKAKRLVPSSDYSSSINDADAIFICVGTPMSKSGDADLSQVFSCAERIAKNLKKYAVVINKSTVPVGTTEKVKKIIKKNTKIPFDVASCPEFLREGSALQNTFYPDRIVIGAESKKAEKILLKIHERLPGERVLTNIRTAEIIKYASNAFLATKISFINEIANLCEQVGADVGDVSIGMGLDPRIGKDFLKAGIGYGGSCFPKDTRALHSMALSNNYNFKLLKAVIEINQTQRRSFIGKVRKVLKNIEGKNIGVLGLAFKNNTDDIRESAAIDIIRLLLREGARVKAYDPRAGANAKAAIPELMVCKKPADVFEKADCVLILTEWEEFKNLDWKTLKKKMRQNFVLDGRNLLEPFTMTRYGFTYISIGR